jgi:hypothetical protein
MIGYTHSDFAGCVDERKSTSRYMFSFGSGVVAWASNKHPIVTLSSDEAQYVATRTFACPTMWMRRIMFEFLHEHEEPTQILCDNKSTTAVS